MGRRGTVMSYRVASEDREQMPQIHGSLHGDREWVPYGVEHAFRLGDSSSACGISLGSLMLFADYLFITERNSASICPRRRAVVSAIARPTVP
jgi:hypothetical protein